MLKREERGEDKAERIIGERSEEMGVNGDDNGGDRKAMVLE